MFFADSKPLFTDEQELERSIRSLLCLRNTADTPHVKGPRVALHLGDAIGSDGDHANLPTSGHRIAGHLSITRLEDEEDHALEGTGSGPVHAFVEALSRAFGVRLEVRDYSEHALGSGADARAVAYVELAQGSTTCFGVATDENIAIAPIRALLAGFNRLVSEDRAIGGRK